MKYLIACPCGHTLDQHDAAGCRGRESPCGCGNDADIALDAAITEARKNPWGRVDQNAILEPVG